MNKIFTIIIVGLFATFTANAQEIGFTLDSYEGWAEQNENLVYVKGKIFYTTTANKAIDLEWIASPNLPAEWQIGICDESNCYSTLESIEGLSTFSVEPNDSMEVKIQFQPGGNIGIGTVDLALNGEGVTPVTASFTLDLVGTSINNVELQNINIYPNPVINNLNVDIEGYQLSAIRIYNLIGKEVNYFETEFLNNYELELNLSELNQGMYLLSLEDENGTAIETRRFSKVN